MLSWIREKFGTVVIGGIIAFIAFVFVFYGVFSPKATRGLHEGAVAGTVNGDSISISDFNRELNRKMEFFKNLGGGKLTDDQLKSFHIRESVFQELANRKLMIQEAWKLGLIASDAEVKEKIQEIPALLKEGHFDLETYKRVLEENHYTPAVFEKLVREDLSMQQWEAYFQTRVRVSEEEIKRDFILTQDQRNLKYVLLTPESAQKVVTIDASDVQKYLADPSKLNIARIKFEEGKTTLYRGQGFDQVKESIVKNILSGDRVEEIQKINQKLAEQVLALLSLNPASDSKINLLLKPYGVVVKTTGWITRDRTYIPNVGESKELMHDAFVSRSSIDLKAGGKPKKYMLAGRTLLAGVLESKKPDLTGLAQQRDTILQKISARKAKDFYQEWMKKLTAKSEVVANPAVVGAQSAGEESTGL